MKKAVQEVIESFEKQLILINDALDRIESLTGKRIDADTLENYWRSGSIETFVDRLCTGEIQDWQSIDDSTAIKLIEEIGNAFGNEAIIDRNQTALARRYEKSEAELNDLLMTGMDAADILMELKKDSRVFLRGHR